MAKDKSMDLPPFTEGDRIVWRYGPVEMTGVITIIDHEAGKAEVLVDGANQVHIFPTDLLEKENCE